MYLIYVNELGVDYKGQKQYEFVFSESTEIEVEEWFTVPASSSTLPENPSIDYINEVGLLKDCDVIFDLIQNSDYFGVIDAVDGVVAMAWEISNFDSENHDRLYFKFGEPLTSVNNKLKKRNLYLIKQNLNLKHHE